MEMKAIARQMIGNGIASDEANQSDADIAPSLDCSFCGKIAIIEPKSPLNRVEAVSDRGDG